MQRAVSLVQNELIRTSQEDGDGLSLVGAAGDLDELALAGGKFFDEISRAELVWGELVDVGDGCCADRS